MKQNFYRIIILIILVNMSFKPAFSKTEEPKYQVLTKENNIEIRNYEANIIAEVTVHGQRKAAASSAFRILADYIFGNNEQNIKISMTAPVRQYLAKADFTPEAKEAWNISFIMPSKFTYAALPAVNNPEIKLRKLNKRKYLVIRFSGLASDGKLKEALEELRYYVKINELRVKEGVLFAFYNPPWTLPFLRRNEIMLELIN